MTASFKEFRAGTRRAVADERLQLTLEGVTGVLRALRGQALAELPKADALRDQLKAIREATLADLAAHLETFERNAEAAGARVHWARDAEEARRIVLGIARQHQAQSAIKSKSMVSEEVGLNGALEAAGITPVETDLGEWIVQLAGEPPSHIIGPALHKSLDEVTALLSREAGEPLPDDVQALTAAARGMLRQKFLDAGIGISGGNLGVAESGSLVLVTNEGNGRMVTSLPPVHVAVMGIEKVVPTWREAAVWLQLLARSATGQPASVYTTTITGPKRAADPDGPRELHLVLLDGGRSRQVGTVYEEVLQCVRCGACLNACPVYRESGGHAYGSPYNGPIGAVVSPLLFGLRQYEALPHASSLCGACVDACPAKIDLPRMLLELRADEVEGRLPSRRERLLMRLAAYAAGRPALFRLATGALRLLQRPFVRDGLLKLPFGTKMDRALPPLAGKPFREAWRRGEVRRR